MQQRVFEAVGSEASYKQGSDTLAQACSSKAATPLEV